MPSNTFFSKILFTLLLTFQFFTVLGQNTPSALLNKWKKAKVAKGYVYDTASVKMLNKLSEAYLFDNTDTSLIFAKQALQLAGFQTYPLGQAIALNNIGKVNYVIGDYAAALDASGKLLHLSNKINYQSGTAQAYQVIGLIYLAQDNYKEAIADFTKGTEIFTRLKDSSRAEKAYFNIGLSYDEWGASQKTFAYLDKALSIAGAIKDSTMITMILNRNGEANFHLKNYDKALTFYQQVINTPSVNTWELDFAYSGAAQVYCAIGDYDKAISNATTSLALSRKVASQSDVVRTLEILAKSYAGAKDFAQAYNYQVQFKKSNDSLFNGQKEKEINYLHLKQQHDDNVRLESNIRDKEQTIALHSRLTMFRNIIAVFFIIFLVLIIRSNRQKTKLNAVLKQQNIDIALQKEEISNQKEKLDKLNHTKDQLFSVISHDLRSPFAAILQVMDFIRDGNMTKKEQEVLLANFHQQISLVTIMVNNLLIWANSQQMGITSNLVSLDVTEVVHEIVCLSNFMAKNKQIKIEHIFTGNKFVSADLDHSKIIIQNLIGNAIKFTPKGGTIKIFYSEDDDHQIIHVLDNGIGILPDKMNKLFKITGREISGYGTNNEAGAGIGLALIKQFVDANDGKIEVNSDTSSGSEFCVYLKKTQFAKTEFLGIQNLKDLQNIAS